jgi:hypothetical protein
MKILFLAHHECDYLSDSIFHGLRSLYGADVVDYPKAERMYKTAPASLIDGLRGHGFTLYGLLDDIPVERPAKLDGADLRKQYDLVIVGDIRREWHRYHEIHSALDKDNAILLDGADAESLYKYAGFFWRRPGLWSLPGTKSIPYFKRELTPQTMVYRCYGLVPERLAAGLMRFAPWKKTSFGVPEEKIVPSPPAKRKVMAAHIVDPEVAAHFNRGETAYAFSVESDYYEDLRSSRFAVTTKRAGWDCLRHYEIAANGCVPCFRDLDDKPESCAPHGLSRKNCIVYRNLKDLLEQIEGLGEERYAELQAEILTWARSNTTVIRARELLQARTDSTV